MYKMPTIRNSISQHNVGDNRSKSCPNLKTKSKLEYFEARESNNVNNIKTDEDMKSKIAKLTVSTGLLFAAGCSNASTILNSQMQITTSNRQITASDSAGHVAKNLKSDLSSIVPDGAGGMVAIFKPNEAPQFVTIGTTSVTSGQQINKNTVSLLGSTSKMFAALTALRLVELKILSLDEKLGDYMDSKYFEIFEEPEKAKNITLRQLLSHTSGLQYDAEYDNNARAEQDLNTILAGMVQKVKTDPTQTIKFTNNPQDHIFSYSSQIWLATIFIEKAYNKHLDLILHNDEHHNLSYADILKKEILNPLEMKRTGFQKSETDQFPFVNDNNILISFVGKRSEKPAYSFDTKIFDPVDRAAGSLWSTPSDLMQLATSLSANGLIAKNGKIIISKPLIQEMISKQAINGITGLGVYNEYNRVGKGGSNEPYGCKFEIDFTTGNAVISMMNFRQEAPSAFDDRALQSLDEMGSTQKPKSTIDDRLQSELKLEKAKLENTDIRDFNQLFVSKFGYIGVNNVDSGLILNWNGSIVAAGVIKEQPDQYMIFDEGIHDGIKIRLATGLGSGNPYLFFENGNDDSQAYKAATIDELPNNNDVKLAFNIMSNVFGVNGKTYKGTRPDGMSPVTLKLDINKILAKCESDKYVPILLTNVLKNKDGVYEIWFVGNHTNPPDKIFKLIEKNNDWVLDIAISDNPKKNVEELLSEA